MARLTVLEYPDPRLRLKGAPVSAFDESLSGLIADMFETLYAARSIGLAATQVGAALRVVVIDVSAQADSPQLFINPQILSRGRIGIVEERCLSVPGILVNVKRATELKVRTCDRSGATVVRDLEGLLAVCLQHEIDHLDGRLSVDHLSFFGRRRIRRQLERQHDAFAARSVARMHPAVGEGPAA